MNGYAAGGLQLLSWCTGMALGSALANKPVQWEALATYVAVFALWCVVVCVYRLGKSNA